MTQVVECSAIPFLLLMIVDLALPALSLILIHCPELSFLTPDKHFLPEDSSAGVWGMTTRYPVAAVALIFRN
jgi:hypothetical protein